MLFAYREKNYSLSYEIRFRVSYNFAFRSDIHKILIHFLSYTAKKNH